MSALRSVRTLMRLGKQRPPRDSSTDDEGHSLIQERSKDVGDKYHSDTSAPISRTGSQTSLDSDNDSQLSLCLIEKAKKTSKYVYSCYFCVITV